MAATPASTPTMPIVRMSRPTRRMPGSLRGGVWVAVCVTIRVRLLRGGPRPAAGAPSALSRQRFPALPVGAHDS
jgi:hypothetical protein